MFPNPYYRFAESLLPCLAEDGMAVLMDVTCRQSVARGGEWSSKQLFNELKCFQRNNPQYRTLFPMVCDNESCRERVCRLFPQLVFDFSEMGYAAQTKLAYWVLCKDALWQKVRAKTQPAGYWLSKTNSASGCREDADESKDRTAVLPECCINVPR